MANWSLPTTTDTYTNFLQYLKDRDLDLAKQFDGVTVTNPVYGMIRWNSTSNYWEKYSGVAWAALTTKYMIDVDKVDGCNVDDVSAASTTTLWTSSKISTFASNYYTKTEIDTISADYILKNGNTGTLTIGTNDASAFNLETNNTSRLSIGSSGNITVSTPASGIALTVNNTAGQNSITATGTIEAPILKSTVATGTAPLTVTSTTSVSNLNADMVDGKHVGTSGNTIPLLDGANTFSNTQTVTTSSATAGLTVTNTGAGVGINTDDIIIGNGAVGTPSLRFANDADTGLYSQGAGYINFTTNGTIAGYFDSSNNLNINGHIGIKDAAPSSNAMLNITNSNNKTSANSKWYGISNTNYVSSATLTADQSHYGIYNVHSSDVSQTVAFTLNQYASYNWAQLYGEYSLNGGGNVVASYNRATFNPQDRTAARCEDIVGTDTSTEVMGYITQSVTSTASSPIVTVTDTSKLAVGDTLWGCSNFTNGATIISVDSATQLTMSANATATGTDATCYFSHNAAVPDNVFGTRTIVRNTDYKTTVHVTYGSFIQIRQDYTTNVLTTSYGLYIDYYGHGATQTPNAWGVYQADNDLSKGNYFGSKVWINTTTDDGLSTKLQVNGAISCTTQATTVSDTRVATTAFATPRTGTTGASVIPSGTTAQRPASPVNGYLRYNSDLKSMEAYVNGAWGSIAGTDNTINHNDYASADGTVGGTIKARISGSTLYITTNGNNA